MNTLKYLTLAEAVALIKDSKTIEDGTVIAAHVAVIESQVTDPSVALVESHCATSDWAQRWSDGMYHYELLVARNGTTPVIDANGDEAGLTVNGSKAGAY